MARIEEELERIESDSGGLRALSQAFVAGFSRILGYLGILAVFLCLGTPLSYRGSSLSYSGSSLSDRGSSLFDRGSSLFDRGSSLFDRGINLVRDFEFGAHRFSDQRDGYQLLADIRARVLAEKQGGSEDFAIEPTSGTRGESPKSIFRTPLIASAVDCDTARAAELIAKSYEIDAVDEQGDTALAWAVRTGCVEIAKLLLNHGADRHRVARNGYSPLTWARLSPNVDLELLFAPTAMEFHSSRK